MDGQNLFEKHGTTEEWKADETAAALIEQKKIEPLIIVGIPNAGALRSQEYLPFAMIDGVSAARQGVREFSGERDHAACGAGVPGGDGAGEHGRGGLIARGDHRAGGGDGASGRVRGKALCESMPLVMKEQAAFKHFAAAKTWPGKIDFGMGGKERRGRSPRRRA